MENPTAGTVAVIVYKDGAEEIARKSALDETGLKVKLENGIMGWVGHDLLDPKSTATQAQVATMLMRFMNK